MAKVKLICTRTSGRWNKGDVASFEAETAKEFTKAKGAIWKLAADGDDADAAAKAKADAAAKAKA